MEQVVYINGELVSREKARISAFDRGFLYGYGLFETMRSYSGRVFCLDRHIARLADSAAFLGIKEALEPEKLEVGVLTTLKANGLEDARIRLTVTAGEGSRGIALPSTGNLTTIITVEALSLPSVEKYSKGLRTSIASIRRNNKSPLCRMKTLGYMENMLAHTEAVGAGCDEAILLNTDGCVAECGASNILIVESGRVVTPPVDAGILPGITRGIVIDLAAKLDIELMQESIGVERLKKAQEVFITNSVIEIMPVASIEGREVGMGCRGKITELLTAEYRKLTWSSIR
jgi:branched-chain amino acid aminotransferase